MKKIISIALTATLLASLISLPVHAAESATETISYNYSYDAGTGYSDETAYTRQMEKLDRGLVAVNTSSGVYLSWRLFDSEDCRYGSAEKNVSFNVYRGSEKIATVTDSTNYVDKSGNTSSTYSVAPVVNDVEGDKCESVTVLNNNYFDIPLTVPETETVVYPDGTTTATYSFFPADCSTGDLDGDGEYEIVIKWTSSERDVGSPGDPAYSGTVRLSAYKFDGTKLWDNDINLGKNVYSSAHTVQFLVYDFDLDGKAEVVTQTSLGSTDASGAYVSHVADPETYPAIYNLTDEDNANTDYRGDGRVITGEEFLTLFNGETGVAVDTITLPTSREVTAGDNGASYGDDFGNRSNRFVANVAYLDGEKPYAVYLRGYYFGRNGRQRTSIAGISFDGQRMNPEYRFDTEKGMPGYYEGAEIYVGNGNHNCSVADVDSDGKDEFITGALCMEVKDDNSFKPRWCTFMEHGDALHIGDYDPTHWGFEFFTVHEDAGPNTMSGTTVEINYGMSVIDADNGDIILHVPNTGDTGRGCMANIGSGGYYQITGVGSYQCNGGTDFTATNYGAGSNFRVFWDGDLYDELLDGTNVTNFNGNNVSSYFNAGNYGVTKINGTKSNPALQADLFGDWREELVYPTTDGKALRVFTTTDATEYKIKTLMHDPVYRSGVAAEQTAYNQPPHVGMYMGSEVFAPEVESIEITKQPTKIVYAQGEELDTTGLTLKATYVDGTYETVTAFTTSGYDPEVIGEQTVTVSYLGKTTTFTVEVKPLEKIEIETPPTKTVYTPGQSIDTTGLKVKAYFEGGIEKYLTDTDYTLSGHKPFVAGEQTITVTYKDKTAEFNISVKKITGVQVVPPSKTTYYQGQSLDTSDMIVYAIYDDGNKAVTKEYILSGYKATTLGEQTVTISLSGNTATFTVKVVPASIASLNNTYSTTSTESVTTNIPIGNYNGSFTIEHKVKVNSIPANGNGNKSSNAGFFVRFMADGQTGGGWYFTKKSDTELNITWKNTRTTSIGTIKLGEEYTFKYNFAEVGTGNGASATLTIIDSNGKQVASVSGLNIRNFSDTPTGRLSPITTLQVNNQANANSTSSVAFYDALVYSNSKIVSVDGKNITLNLTSLTEKLYAAKYENGTLTNVEIIEPTEIGTNKVVTSSFEPDKVFLWSVVYPVDMWAKTE